jgi:hypothetical protein
MIAARRHGIYAEARKEGERRIGILHYLCDIPSLALGALLGTIRTSGRMRLARRTADLPTTERPGLRRIL